MYNIYISDFNYIIVILSFAELHFSVQFNNKVTMQLSNKKKWSELGIEGYVLKKCVLDGYIRIAATKLCYLYFY